MSNRHPVPADGRVRISVPSFAPWGGRSGSAKVAAASLVCAVLVFALISIPSASFAPYATGAEAPVSHEVHPPSALSTLRGGSSVPANLGPASTGASASVPELFGWTGWNGNSTMYVTADSNATPLPLPETSALWVNPSGNNDTYSGSDYSFTDQNGLYLSISNETPTLPFYQTVGGADNNFEADIWFAAAAGAQQYYSGTVSNQLDVLPYSLEVSVSGPTLPPGSTLQFNHEVNTAVNLTNPSSNADETPLPPILLAALDTLIFLLPEDAPAWASLALSSPGTFVDYMGAFGISSASPAPTCSESYPPGTSICEYSLVDNGSTSGLGSTTYGKNVFEEGIGIQVEIPGTELANAPLGQITFSAQDQFSWTHDLCPKPPDCLVTSGYVTGLASSGSTDLSYSIAPAVGIGGYARLYLKGPPASGAHIVLEQTCGSTPTDFEVTANAEGYWHFFAEPGCSYAYSASYSGSWHGFPVSFSTSGSFPATLTSTADAGQDDETLDIFLAGGVVNFSESGLPSGMPWAVTFNGAAESEEENPISFIEVNGSYTFTVSPLTDYSASPSTGTVSIEGNVVPESITFTQTGSYSVNFKESGLPSSDSWSVTVGSSSESASAGTTITFTGLAGTNSYTVSSVLVSETCSGEHEIITYYAPSPSSGTVTNSGTVSVTYTLATKTAPCITDAPAPAGMGSSVSPGTVAARPVDMYRDASEARPARGGRSIRGASTPTRVAYARLGLPNSPVRART